MFKKLCAALGAKEIEKNSSFSTNDLRLRNADKLKVKIEKILSRENTKYWLKVMEKNGVPVGKVNDIKEVFNLDQVKARNMLVDVNLNEKNKIQLAGNPIKISGFVDSKVRKRPPKLNQNKKAILKEFKIKY